MNIGGHSINNVGDPANAQDFVTKKDVDEALARDSDLVTQGKKVINMKVPTARNEGATKGYANSSVDNISSFVKYDGSIPVISELTWGSYKITNNVYPVYVQYTVSKNYVDGNGAMNVYRNDLLTVTDGWNK